MVHVADDALRAALASIDFADVCITSDLTLTDAPAPADAFTLDDVPGVAVVPALAEGEKCARCWQILPDVGTHAHARRLRPLRRGPGLKPEPRAAGPVRRRGSYGDRVLQDIPEGVVARYPDVPLLCWGIDRVRNSGEEVAHLGLLWLAGEEKPVTVPVREMLHEPGKYVRWPVPVVHGVRDEKLRRRFLLYDPRRFQNPVEMGIPYRVMGHLHDVERREFLQEARVVVAGSIGLEVDTSRVAADEDTLPLMPEDEDIAQFVARCDASDRQVGPERHVDVGPHRKPVPMALDQPLARPEQTQRQSRDRREGYGIEPARFRRPGKDTRLPVVDIRASNRSAPALSAPPRRAPATPR